MLATARFTSRHMSHRIGLNVVKLGVICTCAFYMIFRSYVFHCRTSQLEGHAKLTWHQNDDCDGKMHDRVAIVLYGLPRGLSHTHRSIKDNIFEVLRARCVPFEIFFHHVVFLEALSNPRNKEFNVRLDNSEWRLLNPDVELSTEHREFLSSHNEFINAVLAYGDPHHNDGLSTRNELEAMHSLKQAVLAASSKGTNRYRGLVILRPDLIYHDKFDVDLLLHAMSHHLVVLPAWQMWSGANDRFSFGAWEPMVCLGMRFDRILEHCRSTNRSWHAEFFVKWLLDDLPYVQHVTNGNVTKRFCHTTLRASRVRAHGVIKDEDFTYQEESFIRCY